MRSSTYLTYNQLSLLHTIGDAAGGLVPVGTRNTTTALSLEARGLVVLKYRQADLVLEGSITRQGQAYLDKELP